MSTTPSSQISSSREGSTIILAKDEEATPTTKRNAVLAVTMCALCVSLFCVALDITIIATAIPKITDEFHSIPDIGWYGSSYLLTKCAFQLPFGKMFKLFNLKMTFLAALLLFEVGSVVCATAQNSAMLIVGRTIAGIGCGGISSGGLIIIATITPLETRPMFQSIYGSMHGVAAVIGPLIGGALTDRVSWRWCFWINLPLGAFSAVFIILVLHLPPKPDYVKENGIKKLLWNLDPIGFTLFVTNVICLLFALQWGGTTYAWNSPQIIALFTVFAVLLGSFLLTQHLLGDTGTLPFRIATQRTVLSSSFFTFLSSGTFFLYTYLIPLYFQAVRAHSALQSGIDTIPLILPNVLGILLAGFGTSRLGYYTPFIYLSTVLASIGAGLLSTLSTETPPGLWIVYQILFALGSGLGFQLPQIAAQAVLPPGDIATGISISMLLQGLGGTVLISAGNNLLNTHLLYGVDALGLSGAEVLQAGATGYRGIIPVERLGEVVGVYGVALRKAVVVGVVAVALGALPAVALEWRSVKKGKEEKRREADVETGKDQVGEVKTERQEDVGGGKV